MERRDFIIRDISRINGIFEKDRIFSIRFLVFFRCNFKFDIGDIDSLPVNSAFVKGVGSDKFAQIKERRIGHFADYRRKFGARE